MKPENPVVPNEHPIPADSAQRPSGIDLVVTLAAHASLAATWWHFMPGGFPAGHPRWLSNTVIPWLAIVLGLGGIVAIVKSRPRAAALIACCYAWFWITAAIIGAIVFPQSAGRKILMPLLFGLLVLRRGIRHLGYPDKRQWLASFWAAIPAALCSAGFVFAQKSPAPDTRPLNVSAPNPPRSITRPSGKPIRLDDAVSIWPEDSEVRIRVAPLAVTIQPMLRFVSTSPDRCWTSLAPRSWPPPGQAELLGTSTLQDQVAVWFGGPPADVMLVGRPPGRVAEIDAVTHVNTNVYSHLNSYCLIMITGHQRLSLAFSPCKDRAIEIMPSDYPIGRPARAAYMTADGRFRVVEAQSGEKGPFRTLAEGRLERGDPLAISLLDGGRPVCKLTFVDWSIQAGVALSPTAGWGLPVNAIEFSLAGNSPSDAAIYMTLAGTSLGRGWDSVGHAAGDYRNQITVERLLE